MKRIAFTTLMSLALLAGCHRNDSSSRVAPVSTPTSGSVKPEVDTGHEVSAVVSTPAPAVSPVAQVADAEIPGAADPTGDVVEDDFGGTPHDTACTVDHLGVGQGLLESGKVADGIAELEKGVYDEPENFDMRRALGEAYFSQGDMEKAVGHLRVAVDEVDDAPTWMTLARAEFELKDYAQSEKAIRKVAKLDPSNAEPYRLLARIDESKHMWKESIDASEEAIARGSDSPWTFNNLGLALLVTGKYDDAVRELEKAVSFDTGVTPAIWNNLGLAYEKQGQLANAADAYRSSLAGNPDYVKAKVNLKRITELAKAEGIAIGEKRAEIGPEVTAQPTETPAEIEAKGIGEKQDPDLDGIQ